MVCACSANRGWRHGRHTNTFRQLSSINDDPPALVRSPQDVWAGLLHIGTKLWSSDASHLYVNLSPLSARHSLDVWLCFRTYVFIDIHICIFQHSRQVCIMWPDAGGCGPLCNHISLLLLCKVAASFSACVQTVSICTCIPIVISRYKL